MIPRLIKWDDWLCSVYLSTVSESISYPNPCYSPLLEVARKKIVEAGSPVRLQCEVSEPTAQVYWHKDGEQLLPKSEYEIETKEKVRGLVIQSAEVRHSGVYSCEAADDQIEFKVDVAGDLSILSFVRVTNFQLMLGYWTDLG
uniref:Ig-like domain-containing protein n=1 Tax=Stegastes partitus TaxID=144197 RepID=A0A3B5A0G3_9TELE